MDPKPNSRRVMVVDDGSFLESSLLVMRGLKGIDRTAFFDHNPVREPLKCKIYSNDGMPIKTNLAVSYPLLTCRQRRAMRHIEGV